jgi:hypothetical protein
MGDIVTWMRNQDHALQDLEGLTMARMKFLRRGAVHRMQRLRHRLQNEHEVPWA